MSPTKYTEASISNSRPTALREGTHMEFEHVTFDLPHGTFHALQGGDPDGQPTLVLHGFPDHPPTAKPFLAELGRRGPHVVAPWLRGYAPSPTAGPFDFASLTSDVLALIDRWSPIVVAQKTIVTLEDDIDGGPATQTIAFGFDGVDYEIDLNEANVEALTSVL